MSYSCPETICTVLLFLWLAIRKAFKTNALARKRPNRATFPNNSQPWKSSVPLDHHTAYMASESKPPFPPFTRETAAKKVKAAQDAWNTRSVVLFGGLFHYRTDY